ncbi:metallophosphoesterase family protein [uncultured Sphingomonas sp.]|uniref:metallophosphoesterase family protein n=1 Tax=uncultured Sphingomonas sp. TaxID=158754 RepID=UPI0035CBD1C2
MTTAVAGRPHDIQVVRRAPVPSSPRARSTDGRTVYAVGDIHGCYALLTALLEAIVADMEGLAGDRPPLLIFCGDYVDRGPRSSDVLTTLVWLSRHAAIEVAFLRGNHEAMLLDFLDRPDRSLPWLRRDGGPTLRAYGVHAPDSDMDLADVDCRRLRDELMDRMPASHLDFLRALPIRTTCGDYAFVHAGFRPGVPLARQDDEDCLWIREEFLEPDHRFEKVVVHGHSWSSDAPEITPNRVGIDTGAYSTGVLTAVRLEGAGIDFIQARIGAAGPPRSGMFPPGDGPGGL